MDGRSNAAAFLPFFPCRINLQRSSSFSSLPSVRRSHLSNLLCLRSHSSWCCRSPSSRRLVIQSSSESNMPEAFGLSRVTPVPAVFALPGRFPRASAAVLAFARPTSDATVSHRELSASFAGVAAAASESASSAMVSIVCVGAGAGGVECEGAGVVAGVAVCVMTEAGAGDVVAEVPCSSLCGADWSRVAGSCTWSLS